MYICQIFLPARAPTPSLIVASENKVAHATYLKLGNREIGSRPLVTFPGGPGGGQWLLMAKKLC